MVLALGAPDPGGEKKNKQAEVHGGMRVVEGEGWGKRESGLESLGAENIADTLRRADTALLRGSCGWTRCGGGR